MATRINPIHDAARLALWQLQQIGRDLRLARTSAGKTQAEVGRALGISRSWVSKVERGLVRTISVVQISQLAAAVGLKLHARLYPGVRRLLDKPQLELLERLRSRVSRAWAWELEVPMPSEGDLRAADARLSVARCSVMVEAINRLADLQAQLRAAKLKRRDLNADRLLLLIRGSRANRRALHEAEPMVRTELPIATREMMHALAAGLDPGADGIVLL